MPTSRRPSAIAALREAEVSGPTTVSAEVTDVLRPHLDDIALQHDASVAIVWRRPEGATEASPMAWSSGTPTPAGAGVGTQQRAWVEWTIETGVITFDGAAPTVAFGSAAIPRDDEGTRYALMLAGEPSLRTVRPLLKEWLPRHAVRLGSLIEAWQARQKLAESNRRLRLAMRSVEELQRPASPEALEARVLEALRDAGEATFAVLVRWDHETHEGTVRAVVGAHPLPAPEVGDAVEAGDVWEACQTDEPRVWESAKAIAGRHGWLSQASKVPVATSLAIVPMAREARRLGAVVLGTTGGQIMRMADLRPARQVAALAAAALDAAWLLADASTRSRTDALTGLWNRRHFDEQIARIRSETDRFGGESALLILDVDHFKKVNDTHGHEAGDAVLRMVASVLPRLVRATDVSARIGGEEMCVLLPQTGAAGALELAERLRTTIESSSVTWQGQPLRVTASFGVAVYRAGTKGNVWFDHADRALYRAKSGGRNRVELGSPDGT